MKEGDFMTIEELKEQIENVEIDYPLDESYATLINPVIDYMNESQDFSLEYLFEDFIDSETVSYYIKENADDLDRLYYFLGNTDLREGLFIMDAYGNLRNCGTTDLEDLKENILNDIKNMLEEAQEG